MPKFRVMGCFKENEEDVEVIIEATSYREAKLKANKMGILVNDVSVVDTQDSSTNTPHIEKELLENRVKTNKAGLALTVCLIGLILTFWLGGFSIEFGSPRLPQPISTEKMSQVEKMSQIDFHGSNYVHDWNFVGFAHAAKGKKVFGSFAGQMAHTIEQLNESFKKIENPKYNKRPQAGWEVTEWKWFGISKKDRYFPAPAPLGWVLLCTFAGGCLLFLVNLWSQ